MDEKSIVRIGVISDTHGLLRSAAVDALTGSDLILHAGDVDRVEILEQLTELAPVKAVRGNCDFGSWAMGLPERATVDFAGLRIYMLHDLAALDLDPRTASIDVVVFGHSHQPLLERRDGVLFLNPGSAGSRRFSLPTTVAELRVEEQQIEAEIYDLTTGRPTTRYRG